MNMCKKLNLTRGKTLLLSLFAIFSLFFLTQAAQALQIQEQPVYYSIGDFLGTWNMHSLSSGDSGQSGWSYGIVNIDGSGNMTSWPLYQNSDGDTSMVKPPLKVFITPIGIVAVDDDDSFHGVMSLDRNMVVGTVGNVGESSELIILQKSDETFATIDLQGEWNMHSLSSGDSGQSGWSYGTVNIADNGNMTWISFLDSDGDTSMADTPLTVSIDSDDGRTVTVVTFYGDVSFHGVMSDDKKMVVGTAGNVGGNCYELIILQKSSGIIAFATIDLQGEWNMHSLSSGDSGQSGWSYGTVEIDGSGNMTSWPLYRDSDGGMTMEDAPDTAYINLENGTVIVNDDDSFHGVMSDDKRLVVGTAGIVGGGYELIVLQKSVGPMETFYKNIPGGTTASAYVMISSPVLPINQNPLANLEDDLGSYDNTKWRLFRWNPTSSAYEEYPFSEGFGDVVPGKGYWLISRDTKDIDITGLLAEANSPYPIPLSPGWNQIGNPFNFPIAWDRAVEVSDGKSTYGVLSQEKYLTYQTLWKYENGDYTASAVMSPGEGYWIKNLTDGDVTLIVSPIQSTPLEVYGDSLEQTLTLFAKASGEETPPPPPGGTDSEPESDNSSSGGASGCFIATACFGSPMAGEVNTLRSFRDRYLLSNPVGQLFVSTYYRYSPKVADFIAKHDLLKALVRTSLYPVVKGCGVLDETPYRPE